MKKTLVNVVHVGFRLRRVSPGGLPLRNAVSSSRTTPTASLLSAVDVLMTEREAADHGVRGLFCVP